MSNPTRPHRIDNARASKADGSQSLDLQRDALRADGIDDPANLYHDVASGGRDDRQGLDSSLRALRKGAVLVVWKLDRLGRNLSHRVHTVQDLSARGVGLRDLVAWIILKDVLSFIPRLNARR